MRVLATPLSCNRKHLSVLYCQACGLHEELGVVHGIVWQRMQLGKPPTTESNVQHNWSMQTTGKELVCCDCARSSTQSMQQVAAQGHLVHSHSRHVMS